MLIWRQINAIYFDLKLRTERSSPEIFLFSARSNVYLLYKYGIWAGTDFLTEF